MPEDSSFMDWVASKIHSIFALDLPEDIISYILTIESDEEVKEFMQSLSSSVSETTVSSFVTQLAEKRCSISNGKSSKTWQTNELLKKDSSLYLDSSIPSEQNLKKLALGFSDKTSVSFNQPKKRVKQINLFSQEGVAKDVVMLKGRHRCSCQASKHGLVSNCLKCGRIVCTQEGAGPCFFCGNLVTNKEHDEIIARGSKKSEQLIKKLMEAKPEEPPVDESLNQAVEHKNKLLEYDRTCERRTHVIDDESDYYSSKNKWLSASERDKIEKREKEIQELRYGPKKSMKLTIDFAGRRVIEEQPEIHKFDLEAEFGSTSDKKKWKETFVEENEYRENRLPRLTFEDSGILKPTKEKPLTGQKTPVSRLQDSDLQVMSDDGMCISMHQPYASLLVAGIKRHEGRTWYSTHRGRLWVASAVKVPTQQEIKELENLYRHILKDEKLMFPEAYPTGCLLGCVYVSDILPQEEYRNRFPDGESESPYVFVCKNPQELKVKFPVKGAHKLYKLQPQIHQSAKKSLSTLTY